MVPRPRFMAVAWIFIGVLLAKIASSRGVPNRSLLQEQMLIACDETEDTEIIRICEDARKKIDKNGVDLGGAELAVQVTPSEAPPPPPDRSFIFDILSSVGIDVPSAVSTPTAPQSPTISATPTAREVDSASSEDGTDVVELFQALSSTGADSQEPGLSHQESVPEVPQTLPPLEADQPKSTELDEEKSQQQEEPADAALSSEVATPAIETSPEEAESAAEYDEQGQSDQQPSGSTKCTSLMDEIDRHSDLSVMSAALKRMGMDAYIQGLGGNVTVFVPRDAAFEDLAEMKSMTVPELLEDTSYMEKVLKAHIVTKIAKGVDFTNSHTLPTALPGTSLLISTNKDSIFVVPPGGEAGVVQLVDMDACNAVMHVIDTVLLPVMDIQVTVATTG